MTTAQAIIAALFGLFCVAQHYRLQKAVKKGAKLQGQVYDEQLRNLDSSLKDAKEKTKKDKAALDE